MAEASGTSGVRAQPEEPEGPARPPRTGLAVGSAARAGWLESAVAAAGVGCLEWNLRTGFVDWDEQAARLIGVPPTPGNRRIETLRGLIHPEDVEATRSLLSRAAAACGRCSLYLRPAHGGPTPRAVFALIRMLPGADGKAARAVAFLTDASAELARWDTVGHPFPVLRERDHFIELVSRVMSEATTVNEVAEALRRIQVPELAADGLVLLLASGARLDVVGSSGYQPGDLAELEHLRVDAAHPISLAARNRRPLFLGSPLAFQERFPALWPLVEPFHRASWAYLPLLSGARVLGVLTLSFGRGREFTAAERSTLSTLASLVAQAVDRAMLHDTEHEVAVGLQRAMLPASIPAVPGVRVATRYRTANRGQHVGGDWYDVIPLSGGRIGVVVGDVQGHDVHAAGVMGQLRIALRAYASEGHPPEAVLARAGGFLLDLDADRFATCLYAEVDPEIGTADVVRAGHLDPLIRHADGRCVFRPVPGGLPLGLERDVDYPVTRIDLDPDEVLLICTDGLVESRGLDLDQGVAALQRLVAAQPTGDLERLADAIVAPVDTDQRHADDIVVVLLRCTGQEGRPRRRQLRRLVAQADLARIAEVRHELRGALARWGAGELADEAELLVTELVTNTLVHTDSDALLTATLTHDQAAGGQTLRVEVRDGSDLWPRRRTPGEQSSSGRGLLLLDGMTDQWGVEPRGSGKCIWFELRSTLAAR